jgi:hypothetical protein
MVRHQAVSQNLDVCLLATLRHQTPVGLVIVVAEKRLQPPVSALGNVVRQTWNYDAG